MSRKPLPNKYKLTPEADKMIKKLSEGIGKFQRRDKNKNLLFIEEKKFTGVTTENGKSFKNFETVKKPLFINHYINLVEIWQKDGHKGVDMYVKFFHDLKQEQEPEVIQNKVDGKTKLSVVK